MLPALFCRGARRLCVGACLFFEYGLFRQPPTANDELLVCSKMFQDSRHSVSCESLPTFSSPICGLAILEARDFGGLAILEARDFGGRRT